MNTSTKEIVDVALAMAQMNCGPQLVLRLYAPCHPSCRVQTRTMFVTIFNQFHARGSVHRRREAKRYIVHSDFEINVLAHVNLFPEAGI